MTSEINQMQNALSQSRQDLEYRKDLAEFVNSTDRSALDKFANFSKYVSRQVLSSFLFKYEIFKRFLNIHGSIVECGVFQGGGLFSFAQFSAILEPFNHQRRIIGFDTFEGFPSVSDKDSNSPQAHRTGHYENKIIGGMTAEGMDDLLIAADLLDRNRPIGHIPKITLVKGDATKTIPEYLKNNQHTVVSLLYLDFDLYEPTKIAIKEFLPRMPKGAVIAFDQLNCEPWPGEALAVLETIGINAVKIERVPFEPSKSFAVL